MSNEITGKEAAEYYIKAESCNDPKERNFNVQKLADFLTQEAHKDLIAKEKNKLKKIGNRLNQIPNCEVYFVSEKGTEKYNDTKN